MNVVGVQAVSIHVLSIDDSPDDVRWTPDAFREANCDIYFQVASDGAETMAYLRREGDHVDAPGPDLILTMSEDESDVLSSCELQANAYLRKPVQLNAFDVLVKSINDFWLTTARLPQRTGDK